MRQAEFSYDFCYPLVHTVRNAVQIANKIAALFKTEFFNRIGQKRTVTSCLVGEFQSLWGGIANEQIAEAGIEIDTRDRNNTIQFEPR